MLCLFLPVATGAPADPRIPTVLGGPWRVRAGDDPAFADPGYDDAAWRVLDRPTQLLWSSDEELRGASTVWYRTRVAVLRREGAELAIAVTATGAMELYVEGALVGTHGVVGSEVGRMDLHVFPIPPQILPADLDLDVAIRLWAPAWQVPGGSVAAMIGDRPALSHHAEAWLGRVRLGRSSAGGVTALALLAGLVHLYLYARRRTPPYLWFGLGTIFLGLARVLDQAVWGVYAAPFPGYLQLLFGLQAASYAAFVLFAATFFEADGRLARAVAVWVLLVITVRSGLNGPLEATSVWAAIVPGLAFTGYALQRGIRRRLPGARVVAIGISLLVVAPVQAGLAVAGLLPDALRGWEPTIQALALAGMILAMVVGLADRFVASLDELEETHAATRRFVPFELLDRLGRRDVREVRRGDAVRLELTLMFFDIRGFTTLAEARPPEQAFALVSELLAVLEPHVRGNGGFVNQFTGDGYLALFPEADGAVQAAIDMVRAVEGFDAFGQRMRVGLGLHTGTVVLGTLGGRDQLLAGVVADAANLASRIEGMTKLYGCVVLASEVTRARLRHPERFVLREVDHVVAKGRREAIAVVEVVDAEAAPVRAARTAGLEAFGRALAAYRAGAFAAAREGFLALEGDPAAALLAERCVGLAAAPPAGWDGVWRLEGK